jgi:hypothetical protein
VHRVALTSQAGRSMNLGVYAHDYLLQRASQFKADVVDSLLQLVCVARVRCSLPVPVQSCWCKSPDDMYALAPTQDQYGRKSAGGELEDWLLTPLGVVLTMLQDVQARELVV